MQQKLFFLLFLVVGFFLIIFGYLLFSHQRIQIDFLKSTPKFSINTPPSESLTGKIATFSGTVLWESRSAIVPIAISKVQKLQQGESVYTSTGSAIIVFPNIVQVALVKNSGVNIIQTLPTSIVIEQATGLATYIVMDSPFPVSVRSLDLLMSTNSGKFSVLVDPKKAEVGVQVQKGSITLAYENTNFVTQIVTLSAKQTFYFNNNTKKRINSYL